MTESPPPSVSAVVPVYNSEETLQPLVERLQAVLPGCSGGYEIILVNDGSRDGSWALLEKLSGELKNVRAVDLMRNYGQHNALLAGIREARHEIIVTLDDDLQNPPEEIPKLLDRLREGHDVVYGHPEREQHGLFRNFASILTKSVLKNAMGAETARHVSAFRAFRTPLREAFADYRASFVSIDVLLTWATNKFSAIPVRHDPRAAGKSHYSIRKLVTHAFNMITGFTTWPLRLATLMGFLFTLFGVAVLTFVLIRYFLEENAPSGFPFLASIIAIFSGAQLFTLGIFGEYLGRVHLRSIGRPPYSVRGKRG